ncbi:MAG: polysaccharide deacetylase family protein [Deltaproteobacteria bacterium]|nr:polysaccharide deacetylase family protein [Deltaproteobacteria bacterium]
MAATARNLCFHYVTERPGQMRLGIDAATFRSVIERELSRRKPARLRDYLDEPPGPDRFTVSFDDAHVSVVAIAAPILASLGVPATLFVPSAWVGTGRDWVGDAGLAALRALGWDLGAHTIHHPRMRVRLFGEDEAAHAARLEDECTTSRDRLTRVLGHDPPLFAYPYGEDPPIAHRAVEAAGFRACFTVRDAVSIDDDLDWKGDRRSIPRMDALEACGLVRARQAEPLGISVIVPVRDRPRMIGEVVRRWTEQSYPEDRFEVIVVDDGSTAPLKKALDPALLQAGRVRVLRVSEPDRPFRAGQARNAGVEAARFEVIQLADSDVAVDRDFLWAVDWAHQRSGGAGAGRAVLLGALSGYNLHDLGQRHRLVDVASTEDLTTIPIIPDRQREPAVRAVIDNVDWLEEPWRLFYTGNVSFPRALFDEVSGFSDEFSGWGLEDLDLGLRMHRAGATFLYSRFAMGLHLEDEDEPAPRNPFRRKEATRAHFAGYLTNLATWRALHPDEPALARFAERTAADIEEITSRPSSVGIEMGGALPRDGIVSPLHHDIHRVAPGGVTKDELLERVAYAVNVGARRLWLQGGDVAAHPDLLSVLEAAKKAKLGVGMQARPFALSFPGWVARLRERGLDHVTLLVDPAHDALDPRSPVAYAPAVGHLRSHDVDVGARIVARTIEDAREGYARVRPLGIAKIRVALPHSLHEAWAPENDATLEDLAP